MRLHIIAFAPLPLACALMVSGCDKPKPGPANGIDAMDAALVNGAAANGTLAAGTIKVDPAKACKGGDCRAATTSLAEAARRQAARKSGAVQGEAPGDNGTGEGTVPGLAYSNDWAAKLPADLPMMAGAKLSEAAGRDAPTPLRVVSFSAPGDRAAVLAWYMAKAKAAGYTTERADKQGDLVLTGDKPDGAAYAIMIGATAAGRTPVDYIWTH